MRGWRCCIRKLQLLLVAIFFNSFFASSQDLSFRHFSVEDGMASATVYSAMQDDKGYLWMTTESGVNRFNGKKFENFSIDEGLADTEIFGIFQDSYGRIWFLSYNGHFSFYLDGKMYNEKNAPFLKKAYCGQSLMSAHEDSKNRLWINTTVDRVILIEHDKISNFDFSDWNDRVSGVNVMIDEHGNPEFRQQKKIFNYNEQTGKIVYSGEGEFTFFMSRHSTSESTNKYEIAHEGIVKMMPGKEKMMIRSPKDYKVLFYTSVYGEKNGMLWVGTFESGVFLYKIENDSAIFLKQYLPEIQVSNIIKDDEGNIWISAKDDGIYMLPAFGRNTVIYSKSETFPTHNIFSVYCDSKGNIWTGGDRGLITCIDSTGKVIRNYDLPTHENNNYRITDIVEDHNSNMWITTSSNNHRIDKYGNVSRVISPDLRLNGPNAGKSLSVAENGNVYLAFFGGVVEYNSSKNYLGMLPGMVFPQRTFCAYALKNKLYIATLEGLCEYRDSSVYPLYGNDSRLSTRISCIRGIDSTAIAVCTNGYGVYIYRNDTIVQQISVASGLPSNDCRNIFVNNQDLWIVTNKGLVKYHLENEKFVRQDINSAYTGYYSDDIRSVVVRNGKIYTATSRGLIVADEKEHNNKVQGPHVLFLSVKTNNTYHKTDSAINLKYSQNNVRIAFEAISFNNPGQILYEYLLENKSGKPEITQSSEIMFSWLPPGDYMLIVRAKIGNGPWGPSSVLSFTIGKPFWETLWFQCLLGLVVVTLISLPFYLYYKRRTHKKWLELDKLTAVNRERQRISYDLHDDLGSSLTSITMNAAIIKQKQLLELNFNRELEDLTVYANDANEKMSDIVWAVSVSNDHLASLASYINEFIADFELRTRIPCTRKIEENLVFAPLRPEARKNIFLTVKESFHNIQKHSEATQVIFELFVSDNHILNISIRDNGKGFNVNEIMDSSVGLHSMRKRMKEINGDFVIVTKQFTATEIIIRYNLQENIKMNTDLTGFVAR